MNSKCHFVKYLNINSTGLAPCERTAEEVSFEWSYDRISSTDSEVRIAFTGSERVNCGPRYIQAVLCQKEVEVDHGLRLRKTC